MGRYLLGVRFPFACALAAAILLAPLGVARAYCRTTTVHEPVPYDPVASGCWQERKAACLERRPARPLSLLSAAGSKQIFPFSDATRIAHLAFAAWGAAECGDASAGVNPSVQAYDNGPVSADAAADDCGIVPCDSSVHDPVHVIVFDDDSWPFNDPEQHARAHDGHLRHRFGRHRRRGHAD